MKKFLPKTANNTAGFTLIELLVVVSIIVILAVIGLAIFGGLQGRARDAKRKGDVDAIVKAYEIKYDALTGKYPASTAITDTDFAGGVKPKAPESTTAVPVTYNEILSANLSSLTVCAALEGGTSPCTASSATCFCKSGAQAAATTATTATTVSSACVAFNNLASGGSQRCYLDTIGCPNPPNTKYVKCSEVTSSLVSGTATINCSQNDVRQTTSLPYYDSAISTSTTGSSSVYGNKTNCGAGGTNLILQ